VTEYCPLEQGEHQALPAGAYVPSCSKRMGGVGKKEKALTTFVGIV